MYNYGETVFKEKIFAFCELVFELVGGLQIAN